MMPFLDAFLVYSDRDNPLAVVTLEQSACHRLVHEVADLFGRELEDFSRLALDLGRPEEGNGKTLKQGSEACIGFCPEDGEGMHSVFWTRDPGEGSDQESLKLTSVKVSPHTDFASVIEIGLFSAGRAVEGSLGSIEVKVNRDGSLMGFESDLHDFPGSLHSQDL